MRFLTTSACSPPLRCTVSGGQRGGSRMSEPRSRCATGSSVIVCFGAAGSAVLKCTCRARRPRRRPRRKSITCPTVIYSGWRLTVRQGDTLLFSLGDDPSGPPSRASVSAVLFTGTSRYLPDSRNDPLRELLVVETEAGATLVPDRVRVRR